jgi:hypothetical protein
MPEDRIAANVASNMTTSGTNVGGRAHSSRRELEPYELMRYTATGNLMNAWCW